MNGLEKNSQNLSRLSLLIPLGNNMYYLTDFCDQQTACGIPCSARKWFAADSQRFGCKHNLTICRSNNCVHAGTLF